jgi:hypothetical protein
LRNKWVSWTEKFAGSLASSPSTASGGEASPRRGEHLSADIVDDRPLIRVRCSRWPAEADKPPKLNALQLGAGVAQCRRPTFTAMWISGSSASQQSTTCARLRPSLRW